MAAKEESAKPKSWWEVAIAVSTAIIAIASGMWTIAYNFQQERLKEIETVRGMFPHLLSKNKREVMLAVVAIGDLTNVPLSAKLSAVALSPDDSAAAVAGFGPVAVSQLLDESDPVVQQVARSALDRLSSTPTTLIEPAARTTSEAGGTAAQQPDRWVYLGDYSDEGRVWRTRYFTFEPDAPPNTFVDQQLTVKDPLNVRSGMPTAEARFPPVVDVLTPGSKVTVLEVQAWQSTGYMWARVSYVPQKR